MPCCSLSQIAAEEEARLASMTPEERKKYKQRQKKVCDSATCMAAATVSLSVAEMAQCNGTIPGHIPVGFGLLSLGASTAGWRALIGAYSILLQISGSLCQRPTALLWVCHKGCFIAGVQ